MSGDISQQRGDVLSDAIANNDDVLPRELCPVFDDNTGICTGFVVGNMVLNNPTAKTPFNDLPIFPVYTQDEKDKLADLHMLSGSEIGALINSAYNTDIAALVAGSGLDGPQMVSILDAYLTGAQSATPSDPGWRALYTKTFNGRTPDVGGDISPEIDDYSVAMISGLVAALGGKASSSHTHPQSSIDNLVPTLAGKVATTTLGAASGVATLGSDGKLTAGQVPAGLGGLSSFNGRSTAAAMPTAGDYTATMTTYTPHGFVAGVNLQTAMNELIDEVIPLTQKGAVSGVCELDSSQYVPSARLRPADTAVTQTGTVWWKIAKSNETIPTASTEYPDLFRPTEDLTLATDIQLTAFVTSGSAGDADSCFKVEYALAGDSYTAYTDMGITVLVDGSAGTSTVLGASAAIPSGAKTTATRIRLMYSGGNGSTVSNIGHVGLVIHRSVPINTGTTSGAAMVGAIDAELGTTNWRDTASTNSLALNKLVNATGAGIIAASGAGAWAFQTPSAARAILGALQSSDVVFKGRAGATITPTTGDYTSDQITDGSAKVQMTVAERAKVATWREVRFYVSTSTGVGLTEAWAIWKPATASSGTLTLTTDITIKAVSISNWSTGGANCTVQPAGGQGLLNALGNSVGAAGFVIAPATAGDAPASFCFARDGTTQAWRLA